MHSTLTTALAPRARTPLETPLEQNPVAWRRCFWFGLAVVWLMAAVYLQFGRIDSVAAPPQERVNDGQKATFFAVNINPYFVFSEDFHLYVVRSKRIADRGWTDSPLYSHEGEKPDYSSPLQVWLMRLAIMTGGRPWPYAFFMFAVTASAWTVVYLAAARWMHSSVSPLAIAIAVAFTLPFESIGTLLHSVGEYKQWPAHRGLRMATLAWSSPLVLAFAIAGTSLVTRPAKPWGRAAFLAAIISIFALSDMWAFLLCGGCLVVLVSVLGVRILAVLIRKQGELRPLAVAVAALIVGGAIGLALQRGTARQFSPDVMTRAGFGSIWKESSWGLSNSVWLKRYATGYVMGLTELLALACIYGAVEIFGRRRSLSSRLRLRSPSERRLFFLMMVGLPGLGLCVVGAALSKMGMELYHVYQFVWRVELVKLFVIVLYLSELAKLLIRYTTRRWGVRSLPWEFAGAAALLSVVLGYHAYRTHEFINRMPAREYFLTRDEEELRDWLASRFAADERFTLATASHELNYLCAYWTNADLLLPEGFPYHSSETQAAIENRTAQLLNVYNVSSQRWLDFNLFRHGWDQWAWGKSRLLAARFGFMYYLLHRAIGAEGMLQTGYYSPLPAYTTPQIADFKLYNEERMLNGSYATHKVSVESAQRIARLLDDPISGEAKQIRPDVIIVDEVSRFLGTPDFAGYSREFQHGGLEAWVRADSIDKAEPPVSAAADDQI